MNGTNRRAKTPCPTCKELHRPRHRKRCVHCGRRRCLAHTDARMAVIPVMGQNQFGRFVLRNTEKFVCSADCEDAYRVTIALETLTDA